VPLVRSGAPGPFDELGGAIQLGYLDDDTLLALYQGAAVVCVASEQEGFGLPVLEAMACGTPVVTTRAASLPEVGGDAALYADARSPEAMADAIQLLLEDRDEAAHRSVAGLDRARPFTWERTAAAVHEVLVSAASSA
jgi:alpha-1,3-rhamnosyl/mannosyltransferase